MKYQPKQILPISHKIILPIVFLLSFCLQSHATTVLYRISSGEVIEISAENSSFPEYSFDFHAVLTNPPFPDGIEYKGPNAKINDNGTVRNATQQEKNTFKPARLDDRNIQEMNKAIKSFQTNSKERRVLIAILKRIIKELNILRTLHSLPDRDISQLKTAIEGEFDKDD